MPIIPHLKQADHNAQSTTKSNCDIEKPNTCPLENVLITQRENIILVQKQDFILLRNYDPVLLCTISFTIRKPSSFFNS